MALKSNNLRQKIQSKVHVTKLCSKTNTRSPKAPNYEIQGAQHKAYMREIRLSGHPKAKVSRLRHSGALRPQPCVSKSYRNHLFTTQVVEIAVSLLPNQ